jgi:glycosyltransferase involved in cell wall biosynthesis
MTILYLTYDGLTDPLGQSQILPYLRGLSERGWRFVVISCEKPAAMRRDGEAVATICSSSNIKWISVRYHRRPAVFSTIADLWLMARCAAAAVREHRISLIHARSYPAALVAGRVGRRGGIPWVFDMRGYWPDERREAGLWPMEHPLYRLIYWYFKKKEATFLGGAAHIVSLTHASKAELLARGLPIPASGVSVIPCAADFRHFDPERIGQQEQVVRRAELGIPEGSFVLIYTGSTGTWYLLREMFRFFAFLTMDRPDAHFLILTTTPADSLEAVAREEGLSGEQLSICRADRGEMPAYLSLADLGICLLLPAWSKMASSPVKVGEMMAMGLPVVCNNTGDAGLLIEDGVTGLLLQDVTPATLRAAARQALTTQFAKAETIRTRARAHLDLDQAKNAYHDIYQKTVES